MKASTLLTAMVLLLGAAAAPNYLTIIFNEIPKLNQSSLQDFFVEDLTHLAEGVDNCGDGFFCRVRDILLHKNFSKLMDEEKSLEEEKKLEKNEGLEKIERNLKQYLHHRNVNCSLVLEDVRTSNVSTQFPQFWRTVSGCIQKRNFHGYK